MEDASRRWARVVVEIVDGPPIGSLSLDEPCGSISSEDATGRTVYVFGARDGLVGVWQSVGGIDVANDAIREIFSTELALLADLAAGDYELPIERNGRRLTIRFRLEAS